MTTANKIALIDGRRGPECTWTATSVNHGFTYDLGAATIAQNINRCVLAPGHTLDDNRWNTFSTADSAFANVNLTLRNQTTIALGNQGVVDLELSADVNLRYWMFRCDTSVNGDFIATDFWPGHYEQLGDDLQIGTKLEYEVRDDVVERTIAGSEYTVELSPPRKAFTLEVGWLNPGTDDFDIIDRVVSSRSNSFWYWPPDDAIGGPYLVKLTSSARREQDHPVPRVSNTYRVRLEMVEQIG
tara:strand:+ start:4171 stop:4896 length:726 start_codon:yes stop_codon:yes gene_type:complete